MRIADTSRLWPWPLAILAIAGAASLALAGDFTSKQVTERLYRLEAGAPPIDFSGKSLENLDLAGLDFKGAKLEAANLFGADLTGAKLNGVNLKRALLDRANLIGASFDGADLSNASVLRPTTTTALDVVDVTQIPSFKGAILEGTKLFGNFSGGNFANARMKGAFLAPFNDTGFIEILWHTDLTGANLEGADLSGADLGHVSLRFANLRGANLQGAKLKNVDLTRADLTNADLTGAEVSNAAHEGIILEGAKGVETIAGLKPAVETR